MKSYIMFDENKMWDAQRGKFEDNTISDDDKIFIEKAVDKSADYLVTDFVSLFRKRRRCLRMSKMKKRMAKKLPRQIKCVKMMSEPLTDEQNAIMQAAMETRLPVLNDFYGRYSELCISFE